VFKEPTPRRDHEKPVTRSKVAATSAKAPSSAPTLDELLDGLAAVEDDASSLGFRLGSVEEDVSAIESRVVAVEDLLRRLVPLVKALRRTYARR
jgi:hypothetical protein